MRSEQEVLTAYHEAGHAVIARAFDLKVSSVTIIPNPDLDYLGVTNHYSATLDIAPQLSAIERDVKVQLAGPVAECQYEGVQVNYDLSSSDLTTANALVAFYVELKHDGMECEMWSEECGQVFDEFSLMTERLVDEHWSAIERVAQGLLDFRVLNGTEVDDLICPTAATCDLPTRKKRKAAIRALRVAAFPF